MRSWCEWNVRFNDGKYFSGSLEDLILSRSIISLPLLRKDFVIDEYQIIEAKLMELTLFFLLQQYYLEMKLRIFRL